MVGMHEMKSKVAFARTDAVFSWKKAKDDAEFYTHYAYEFAHKFNVFSFPPKAVSDARMVPRS